MNKIDIINREKKERKLQLNDLYKLLKEEIAKGTSEDILLQIKQYISILEEERNILLQLYDNYNNGTGEQKLTELTEQINEEYNSKISSQVLKENDFNLIKTIHNKEMFDNINEIFLTKEEIYDYLYNYNEVIKIARNNIFSSIYDIFIDYMNNTNQQEKANSIYYINMIKLHVLYDNISIISIIKDEDFEHLNANDEELNETDKTHDLSFLKNCFLNPLDYTRFKKNNIFNFIRNSFYHSDNSELYKISTSCNSVFINLKETNPVPFSVKLSILELENLAKYISRLSHHAVCFMIENQEKINSNNLIKDYKTCKKELSKTKLKRIYFPNKTEKQKHEINQILRKNNILFSHEATLKELEKHGDIEYKEYDYSDKQIRLLYEKFKMFYTYYQPIFNYLIASIIFLYAPNGISKLQFYIYDTNVGKTYLSNGKINIFNILKDILYDFDKLKRSIPISQDSIWQNIDKEIDYSKPILLYVFDDEQRENMNEAILLTYAFCTLNNDKEYTLNGISYEMEHIRNAFAHGRWQCYIKNGVKYFSLYDDEDLIVNPNNPYWKKDYTSDELLALATELRQTSKIKTKILVKKQINV